MKTIDVAYSKNREFHSTEFQNLGPTAEVLWKGGTKSQHDRFEQITRILPNLSNKSLLDVGCGFGDFYSYVNQRGTKKLEYSGIDLCPEMVRECRKRHPSAEFHEVGVLEHEADPQQYDYSIASGIFAMPHDDWDTYVVKTLGRMFDISRSGLAVNFLSSYSQSPSKESRYANPGHVLELLMKNISPWVVLVHDYRWNDFTIGIFREQQHKE